MMYCFGFNTVEALRPQFSYMLPEPQNAPFHQYSNTIKNITGNQQENEKHHDIDQYQALIPQAHIKESNVRDGRNIIAE